ncbi:hypothetical protein PoB_004409900 [Plakobranchus ocellatus]|uniref:THD domain-containing protein n=1 Tax=Plakobranchus ocellatus TaxID=259542 RepID=A0AAV4BGX3_9GAST|nr:hypothetical protein PoB_004409900 [Plakobranchus ocellatus]
MADKSLALIPPVVRTYEQTYPSNRWTPVGLLLVGLISLSSAVLCLGVCVYSVNAVSNLEAKLGHTEKILGMEREQMSAAIAQAVTLEVERWKATQDHSISKRSSRCRCRRGRRRRTRRNNPTASSQQAGTNTTSANAPRHPRHTHQHRPPPFFHLVGTNSTSIFVENGIFKWHPDYSTYHMPGLGMEPSSASHVAKIRVDHMGIYEVYSQVVLNGCRHLNDHDQCGIETVRWRGDSGPVVLLQSRITQYNLGDNYSRRMDSTRRAYDTIAHRGTFKLLPGDRLAVRRMEHCRHIVYLANPTTAHFGVVQLYKYR